MHAHVSNGNFCAYVVLQHALAWLAIFLVVSCGSLSSTSSECRLEFMCSMPSETARDVIVQLSYNWGEPFVASPQVFSNFACRTCYCTTGQDRGITSISPHFVFALKWSHAVRVRLSMFTEICRSGSSSVASTQQQLCFAYEFRWRLRVSSRGFAFGFGRASLTV